MKTLLAATNSLDVTAQGRLTDVEATLMDVIDNCKESVAVLSLSELTFLRGNRSTSLYFGDFYLHSKVIDFVYEQDRHILLECIVQLLQNMDDAHELAAESNRISGWENSTLRLICDSFGVPWSLSPEENVADQKNTIDEESHLLAPPAASYAATSTSTFPPPKHNSINIMYRVYDSHNALLWLESTVLLHKEKDLDNNNIISIMLLTRDITDKKEAADAEVRENSAKLQYITCCAHDLKTPLQSFSSALDLMMATPLTADQKDILNQAEISLSLMNLTIAQTMDTSKVLMVLSSLFIVVCLFRRVIHENQLHLTSFFLIYYAMYTRVLSSNRKMSTACCRTC